MNELPAMTSGQALSIVTLGGAVAIFFSAFFWELAGEQRHSARELQRYSFAWKVLAVLGVVCIGPAIYKLVTLALSGI